MENIKDIVQRVSHLLRQAADSQDAVVHSKMEDWVMVRRELSRANQAIEQAHFELSKLVRMHNAPTFAAPRTK